MKKGRVLVIDDDSTTPDPLRAKVSTRFERLYKSGVQRPEIDPR